MLEMLKQVQHNRPLLGAYADSALAEQDDRTTMQEILKGFEVTAFSQEANSCWRLHLFLCLTTVY